MWHASVQGTDVAKNASDVMRADAGFIAVFLEAFDVYHRSEINFFYIL